VAAWRADGVDIWLSVNLSERQLAQRDLCAVVERTLRESGLPAWALCLEVAESVYLRRPNEVGAALDVLRRLGVRVALDAFGGGASSPADLGRLPVDVVKIDRSLIARLRGNSEDRAVVEAMLEQARRRAVTVVACGVETTAEEQVLRDLGCPVAQGFLYGRPAEAAAFAPGSRDTAQGSIASSHP
jgi:EAL domain-containing protein (putative c-di-GMP-specific phosphodiesterase class I)